MRRRSPGGEFDSFFEVNDEDLILFRDTSSALQKNELLRMNRQSPLSACSSKCIFGPKKGSLFFQSKMGWFEVELEGYFEKTVPESKDSKQPGRRPSRPFADRFSDADSA